MAVKIRALVNGCKIEDSGRSVSARINHEGVWCSFRLGGSFYRRCMDGSLVEGKRAKTLSTKEAERVHVEFKSWICSLTFNHDLINKSQSLSDADYEKVGKRYRRVYPEGVTILPPDRYGDIVVLPSIGCPNRRCTFCAFYKDKPYGVLNASEFVKHLQSVKALYSHKVKSTAGVFLGSANAMALSQRRLMSCLANLRKMFGAVKRGVAAFSDPDFSAKRSESDWCALKMNGLEQIVIGMETGWESLRASLGKSGDLNLCTTTVQCARRAGINVGLTVLTGVAPKESRGEHKISTLNYIDSLQLSERDIVYLSPLSDHGCVSEVAIKEQIQLKALLAKTTAARIVPYQMQRFRYFM